MRFLFLEPFFGGSHQDFTEGLIAHSAHEIELLSLPARFWKWRMRGAALYFYQKIDRLTSYDGLITSDLMSLADFKALAGSGCPPALVYFHENQLTYPLAPGEERDYQFGFTDITTALAATRVLFNSRTHFKTFFTALPAFIGMMPDYPPHWVVTAIRAKAAVLHPGCHFEASDLSEAGVERPLPRSPGQKGLQEVPQEIRGEIPLIIWNHRWEFDKNPADFFAALDALLDKGVAFRLALLGERFQQVPHEFVQARLRYRNQIVQYGFVPSRQAYFEWLRRGTVVVSTAHQENFGIAVVEAIRFGCLPLLPKRLVYPEIIPPQWQAQVLYEDQHDLIQKLADVLVRPDRFAKARRELSRAMAPFAWKRVIARYDAELTSLAAGR